MTNYQYTLLRNAHQRKATKLGCTFGNFGWVVDDGAICSKTSMGYLTTKHVGHGKYEHQLEAYA
jgi:hypothetical protein